MCRISSNFLRRVSFYFSHHNQVLSPRKCLSACRVARPVDRSIFRSIKVTRTAFHRTWVATLPPPLPMCHAGGKLKERYPNQASDYLICRVRKLANTHPRCIYACIRALSRPARALLPRERRCRLGRSESVEVLREVAAALRNVSLSEHR